MNLIKLVTGFSLVFATTASVYAGQESHYPFGEAVPTDIILSPHNFDNPGEWIPSMSSVPYINFSATVKAIASDGSHITIPFYPSWTPPSPYNNNGSRPYHTIRIQNASADTLKFVFTNDESVYTHPSLTNSDNMCWVKTGTSYTFVDDDSGIQSRFGTKVILGPHAAATFRVSMYYTEAVNGSYGYQQWFGVRIEDDSRDVLLDSGYKTVYIADQYSDPVIY